MGSVIIKASHVGTSSRSGVGYPGPATDEQMEIAKRAAKHTRKDWATKKKKNKKHGKTKPAKRAEQSKKPAPQEKLQKNNSKEVVLRAEGIIRKPERQAESIRAKQARKLGISEAELERRVKVLQQWHAEAEK